MSDLESICDQCAEIMDLDEVWSCDECCCTLCGGCYMLTDGLCSECEATRQMEENDNG